MRSIWATTQHRCTSSKENAAALGSDEEKRKREGKKSATGHRPALSGKKPHWKKSSVSVFSGVCGWGRRALTGPSTALFNAGSVMVCTRWLSNKSPLANAMASRTRSREGKFATSVFRNKLKKQKMILLLVGVIAATYVRHLVSYGEN